MQEISSDKRNLIVTVIVVVVVAALLLFIWRRREGFEEPVAATATVAPEQVAVASAPTPVPVAVSEPVAANQTVAVGTLIDGPSEPVGISSKGAFSNAIPDNFFFLDDGDEGRMSVQNNLCSKNCCSSVWPAPFQQESNPYVCAALKNQDLVPSDMFCNNSVGLDSGCMCLSKNQARFLQGRGSNSSPWY